MARTKGIARKACIAIAILGVAFAAVPSASAICVGNAPWWFPDGSCGGVAPPIITPWDYWYVCVTDDPVNDCID